jgi:hypothetical protein
MWIVDSLHYSAIWEFDNAIGNPEVRECRSTKTLAKQTLSSQFSDQGHEEDLTNWFNHVVGGVNFRGVE